MPADSLSPTTLNPSAVGLSIRLRVARAWQDWNHAQAAKDFGVSRQTWVAYEGGDIPPERAPALEAWCLRHTPETDASRAHAFGMLEATGRMSRLVADISDDARRRLGDPTMASPADSSAAVPARPSGRARNQA